MMTGVVTRDSVLFRLKVGTPQRQQEIEARLVTGFGGHLALPPTLVKSLDLPFLEQMEMPLINGSTLPVAVHKAIVEWQGQERTVPVYVLAGEPQIGTALLEGCQVRVEFRDGGRATIEPVPG